MTPLSMFASRRFTGLTVLTFLLYGALSADRSSGPLRNLAGAAVPVIGLG